MSLLEQCPAPRTIWSSVSYYNNKLQDLHSMQELASPVMPLSKFFLMVKKNSCSFVQQSYLPVNKIINVERKRKNELTRMYKLKNADIKVNEIDLRLNCCLNE